MSGWSLWITNSTPLSFILVIVQLLSQDRLFATPWTAACQAFLSFTISQSLLKLVSIESVMPSNHLIFCRPLLLLPSTFPSIRVFSKGLALLIRWSKYWSFSLRISPSSVYSGLISFKLYKPSSINKRQQGAWNTKLCGISGPEVSSGVTGGLDFQKSRRIFTADNSYWGDPFGIKMLNFISKTIVKNGNVHNLFLLNWICRLSKHIMKARE